MTAALMARPNFQICPKAEADPFRLLIVLMVMLPLLLACPRHAEPRFPYWAVPLSLPESNNLYLVTPKLYRAAQPSIAAFHAYSKMGIRTVINLRAEASDQDLVQGLGLNLVEVPMEAGNIRDEDVVAVLREIRRAPGPVLVHCHRGADRTGVIMAMYRILFENWTREAALEEMVRGGYHFGGWKNITRYVREADLAALKAAVWS